MVCNNNKCDEVKT